MEQEKPQISAFCAETPENYAKIKEFLQNDSIAWSFKQELVGLLRSQSSKTSQISSKLLIDSGLIPLLMSFASKIPVDEDVLLDILWICTNVVSSSADELQYFVDLQGIDYFFAYLSHHRKEIRHQALWGLTNIVGESQYFRDLLLKAGVLQRTLENFAQETEIPVLRTISWFFDNISRGKPGVSLEFIQPGLPFLNYLAGFCDDVEIFCDFLWCLAHLTEISQTFARKIQELGVIAQVFPKFQGKIKGNPKITTPFLRILGNFAAYDEISTQFVVDLQVFPLLRELLDGSSAAIRKEIVFIYSNIAAGTLQQQLFLVETPEIFEKLAEILAFDEKKVKKEACWVLMNLFFTRLAVFAEKVAKSAVISRFFDVFQEFVQEDQSFRKGLLKAYVDCYKCVEKSGNQPQKQKFCEDLKAFVEKNAGFGEDFAEIQEILQENATFADISKEIGDLAVED